MSDKTELRREVGPQGKGGARVYWFPTSSGDTSYVDRLAARMEANNWCALSFDESWFESELSYPEMGQAYASRLLADDLPCVFAGWGLGGLAAIECARASGMSKAAVLAIESAVPREDWKKRDTSPHAMAGLFAKHVSLWRGDPPLNASFEEKNAAELARELYERVIEHCPDLRTSPQALAVGFATFQYQARAANAYRADSWPLPIVLAEVPDEARAGRALGWDEWFEGVEHVYLEGDHYTLLAESNLAENAPRLSGGLARAIRSAQR